MYQPTRRPLLAGMRRTAATVALALLGALMVGCGSANAAVATGSSATVWGAVGDSITMGWGSSDQATKAYYEIAGVQAAANPGQCLVATACAGSPLVDTFATELNWLHTTRGGVNAVVVEIGVNDLPRDITDRQFVLAYRLLQSTGRAQGVRVVLSTITPRRGLTVDEESQRERINTWIRSQGPSVNYAAALGGNTLLPQYDSGDGLHPSDAGHARMAERLTAWIGSHLKAGAPAPVCVRAPCGVR